MFLFLMRLITAIAFYACAALVHQSSVAASTILIGGYRIFLALTPYVTLLLKQHDLRFSLVVASLGIAFCSFNHWILGSLLIAFGLSISGFIVKSIAAETPRTSALNKIAITSGHIGAGSILWMVHNKIPQTLLIVGIMLICLTVIQVNRPAPPKRHQRATCSTKEVILGYLLWLCFGLAIGIRIFGIYNVVPQYLQMKLGELPNWYGAVFGFYGVVVILVQLPAVMKKKLISLQASILALAASCVVIGLPDVFRIETFPGAIVWCFCLALEELFAPYLDFYAVRANTLLIKELSIGLGGGLSILILNYSQPIGLSFFALMMLGLGWVFFYAVSRISTSQGQPQDV